MTLILQHLSKQRISWISSLLLSTQFLYARKLRNLLKQGRSNWLRCAPVLLVVMNLAIINWVIFGILDGCQSYKSMVLRLENYVVIKFWKFVLKSMITSCHLFVLSSYFDKTVSFLIENKKWIFGNFEWEWNRHVPTEKNYNFGIICKWHESAWRWIFWVLWNFLSRILMRLCHQFVVLMVLRHYVTKTYIVFFISGNA